MERKLNNAKIIKKMKEDRRDIEINRLNEKWNRQVNPQNRKSDIEIQPNIKVKIIDKTIQKKKQKIKKLKMMSLINIMIFLMMNRNIKNNLVFFCVLFS